MDTVGSTGDHKTEECDNLLPSLPQPAACPSVSTGQHTQWFLMAAKCAPSVPVLHTAAWCWCVTLPPDLSPIIQPSNQKSSQSNTNTSVRVFIDELNFCTLLEGDKLQVQWIVNIVHLRILHSNLMIPRWREHYLSAPRPKF